MAEKNSGMDLSTIGVESETARMTLYHPSTGEPLIDGDGNSMWIEVYGQDSAHYKKTVHAQTNRRIQQAQRAGGRPTITAEQQDANGLEVLVKCTVNWYIVLDGDVPECSEKNVRGLYADYPWIREQVDGFIHDRTNFLKS